MKQHILHITPWYPHASDPMNALWIARHIKSLEPHFNNHVLHLDENTGRWLTGTEEHDCLTRITIRTPVRSWRLREWRIYRELKKFLAEKNAKHNFDVVNFHVAYPNCVYISRLKKLLPERIIITEHWSYYHFNFYSTKKLSRIRKIFSHGIPVISVSRALANDIQQFAGYTFPSHIVPNIVETDTYHFDEQKETADHFFMAARWKSPKTPVKILEAVAQLRTHNKTVKLRIAGFGNLVSSILQSIESLGLNDVVQFIGPLDMHGMAREYQSARGFILPTGYETFSVVCAEALCCGCPVLSEPHGAIPELINDENGMLKNDIENWSEALLRFESKTDFDRRAIAGNAASRYNMSAIGEQYSNLIKGLE